MAYLLLGAQHLWAQNIMAQGGTVTAQYTSTTYVAGTPNSPATEDYTKVTDGDVGTKYLLFCWPAAGAWIQWECNTPAIAGQYSLTSGADAPERDPKEWTLEGSNDASGWILLDTRTAETFADRSMTKTYTITNTTAYRYYRLTITAIANPAQGTDPWYPLFQLAEWTLLEGVKPEMPTNLTATVESGHDITLSWADNSSVESGFAVERSSNGTDFSVVDMVAPNTTIFFDTDLTHNTTYYYRVYAFNAYGNSTATDVVSATTLNVTGHFYDLTDDGGTFSAQFENTTNSAESSGKLVDNNYGTKYLLFFSQQTPNTPPADYWFQYQSVYGNVVDVYKYTLVTANDAPNRDPKDWTFEGSNNGTSWTVLDTRTNISTPLRNTPYSYRLASTARYKYYRIHVTNNNGSTSIAGQIAEWQIWAIDPNEPLWPENLTATATSFSEVNLSWQDKSGNETGFVVERSTDGQYFAVVKTLPANTTSYADKSLTPLVTYYYRVKATGAISNSSYSNVASVTTPYDMNLPLWPTSLTATTISDQEITLSWVDNSDNETGFEIQRSLNGTSYLAIDTVGANVTTFTNSNLMLGTQYYYRVAGINSHGKSPFSNVATSVTTGSNQPPTINAVGNIETCVTSASTIPLTGITCGPESGQKVTLAVVSDNAALFDQLMVSSVGNGEAILTYQIKAKTAGTATVTVTAKDDGGTNNGGNDTYSVNFTITASPLNVAITSDQGELVPRGSIVNLTATGGEFYEWADGPGIQSGKNLATLTIHPMYSYTYLVKTTTSEGCTGDASITIQLNADYNVEPVNILTPNGDGRNDVWVIWNINIYKGSEVKVFDMRGIEVFRMKDYNNSWNGTYKGTPLSQGTYPYVIDLGSGFAPIKGVLTIIHEK